MSSSLSDKEVAANGNGHPGEKVVGGGVHDVAERGHAATDQYGHAVVEIDHEAERKLRLKIDLYIVPTVALLYLFCFIDRTNIGNARLAGFEDDLNLKGNDYNVVLSIFYISYIIFEIPANLLCKKMGPGWFLPLTSVAFGVISVGTAFVDTRAQACAVRFLLGIAEAGVMPGTAYYLSRWYRRAELTFRLGLYIVMAPLAGAFGGLLASAILKLDHFGSLHQWRMIFGIEGIVTIGLSLVAFLTLTDSPQSAKWLTKEEKDLAIARIKSERIGTTVVLDKIDTGKVFKGMFNPITMATSFIFLLNNITVNGLAFFTPTILRTIYPEKGTIDLQLLTVPGYVLGAVFTIVVPTISWRLDKRVIFLALSAPLVMSGYIMFLASDVPKVRFAATFLCASSAFMLGPMTTGHISANVISDTARSSAIGMMVMMGNIGGLCATWTYTPKDGPNYPIGNGLNVGTSSMILITSLGMMWWMKRENKRRDGLDIDAELSGLTQKQIEDLDWKHPGFRFKF